MVTTETQETEAKASPRNPNVKIFFRSYVNHGYFCYGHNDGELPDIQRVLTWQIVSKPIPYRQNEFQNHYPIRFIIVKSTMQNLKRT
jgi:hypothetical protein